MERSIKKLFSFVFVVIAATLLLVACGTKITKEALEALEFNDATFAYDGEVHSIYIDNIYEEQGVEITYKYNEAKLPGEYTVSALIKYEEILVTKKAKITITKLDSVLTAEPVQTVILGSTDAGVIYSLDNDSQTVKVVNEKGIALTPNDYSFEGTYQLELYAPENTVYNESNHVKVTYNVVRSLFNASFKSENFVYDGTEKVIELTADLPAGYTVEYENNKATEVGRYFATAKIKNANGEVEETHRAVIDIDYPDNEEFKKYLDDLLVWYLEGDASAINVFVSNPENYGFEDFPAEYYIFERFTDEDIEHDLNIYKELLTELEVFKDYELSDLQRVAYRSVEEFINYYIDLLSIDDALLMRLTYIDQFGGYVAEYSSMAEGYILRTEDDVQDLIDITKTTKDAFNSYLDFAAMKTEAGYPYSNFTINEMRGYLEDVLEQEEYYIIEILENKIDSLEFLDETKKAEYKASYRESIEDYFLVGVQDLYDGLEEYLGKLAKEDEGYWTKYENGDEIYKLSLEERLGMKDIDLDAYVKEVEAFLNKAVSANSAAQKRIINKFYVSSWTQFEEILKKYPIYEGTPEEMVVYLKEFAKNIVPELKTESEIFIKEMDEASAKVSNAVAYYRKSAVDEVNSKEYITLNPDKLGSSSANDILDTLAHEGYPGHLYAYVFSKEIGLSDFQVVNSSVAHAEGWATYVELKLFEFSKNNSSNQNFQMVMDYLYSNALAGHLLETRIDVGIHYEKWTVKDVSEYLGKLGYNSGAAQEIYDLIIEMPSQYASYGYGKLKFYTLNQEAKATLGVYYDEISFNTMLLSKGWTSMDELMNTYNEYMEEKCFEAGIEWNK